LLRLLCPRAGSNGKAAAADDRHAARNGGSASGGYAAETGDRAGGLTSAQSCFLRNQAESLRFRLLPWIDRWSRKQLRAGDNIVSSYGYANDCFKFVRQHGGKTFLDAGKFPY